MGNSIILSWKAPKNTGGSDITEYIVSSTPENIHKTVTGSLSTSLMNLTPGTSYTFTVVAKNKYGESPQSAPSGSVLYNTPPTEPTAVVASVLGDTISVKWKAPSSSGGVPIKSYRVISSPDDVIKRVVSGLSATFPGLTPGVGYTFKVTATNSNGTSVPSESSKPVMIELPLQMPQNVVAKKTGERAITVTWDPYPAAFNVKYYKITASPGDKTLLRLNTTSIVFENLEFNKAYTFTVVAVTNTSTSPLSLASNEVMLKEPVVEDTAPLVVARLKDLNNLNNLSLQKKLVEPKLPLRIDEKPRMLPSAPLNVSIALKNHSFVLSWDPPANTGGEKNLKYKIRSVTENDTAITSSTIIQIMGVSENKQYTYEISAVTTAGDGPSVVIKSPIVPMQHNTRRIIGQRKIRCAL
jgi:hypothetical protein